MKVPIGLVLFRAAANCNSQPGTMGKLTCKSPVPSDIEIAQAAEPVPITEIANKLGLASDEYELHGPLKAKVGAPQTP